jgi:signal transduction histidine kinase
MKRLPLLWRVFLSTSTATTLLFVLIGYLVQSHLLRTTSQVLEEELRSSFKAYQTLWTSRSEHLASISQLIAGMADVRAAFGTGDAATIRDTAGELWSRISRRDAIFLVTDPKGGVIASLSGPDAKLPGHVEAVGRVSASFPRQGSGFSFLGDVMVQMVVTPVYVDSGRGAALINVLVAGYTVDDTFAAALKSSTAGSDSLIIAGGRVVASTLPPQTTRQVAEAQLVPGQLMQVPTGEDTWSVLPMELTDVTGARIGEVRVLRPFTPASRALSDLRMQIAVIWAVAILLALLVTFVLARRLLGPVRLLDVAAREVSSGNYDYRVPAVGEDEMGRLGRTFNQMCASIRNSREELIRQERITTLGRVASSIVHDLRNPLAAIYGGAEMLVDAEGLPQSHVKRLAGNIYKASRQILTLLDDLMAVTRGQAPDAERCKVRDIVEDAWSSLAPQADETGSVMEVREDLPVEATLVRPRIERVFVNLFANAIQAMPEGGRIQVEIRADGDSAIVKVCDSGPGVSPSVRENLFQPFASAGKSNGLGLGLALSRQTVMEHGGELWLEPSSRGACFCLRLPRRAVPTVSALP